MFEVILLQKEIYPENSTVQEANPGSETVIDHPDEFLEELEEPVELGI